MKNVVNTVNTLRPNVNPAPIGNRKPMRCVIYKNGKFLTHCESNRQGYRVLKAVGLCRSQIIEAFAVGNYIFEWDTYEVRQIDLTPYRQDHAKHLQ